ncbi:hypothetical protein PHAVU_010G068000 [Phaseolus vulgaris]|uniref:Uncharacterized protein n=1 Tax=Phaseolus vulgaris TaxID=3885 RepID=V7AMH9_PHAVU|nr:hypothetical protein PHAVU_010G068000g [Phaseolus vulgaris]ESW06684.1 hypothetical protein PHAVU_010G068000g [Phaseolus vulgaris]
MAIDSSNSEARFHALVLYTVFSFSDYLFIFIKTFSSTSIFNQTSH